MTSATEFPSRRQAARWALVAACLVAACGDSGIAYGTVMAIRVKQLPYFSSNRALATSEVCNGDSTRYDYIPDHSFCPDRGDQSRDDTIRLGGKIHFEQRIMVADASEAMQYTIEHVSKFGCRPGSCQ